MSFEGYGSRQWHMTKYVTSKNATNKPYLRLEDDILHVPLTKFTLYWYSVKAGMDHLALKQIKIAENWAEC